MKHESEADEWNAKAQRAEEEAAKASDKATADTWSEIARIYREIAARREAWESAWKPRLRSDSTEKDDGEKPR